MERKLLWREDWFRYNNNNNIDNNNNDETKGLLICKIQKKLPKHKMVGCSGKDYSTIVYTHTQLYTHDTEKDGHKQNTEVADDPQVFGSLQYQMNSNRL